MHIDTTDFNAFADDALAYIDRHDTYARNATRALVRHMLADVIIDPACTPRERVDINLIARASVCDAEHVFVYTVRVSSPIMPIDTAVYTVVTDDTDRHTVDVYNRHPIAQALVAKAKDWDYGV